jgi:hypothetical protein
LTTCPRNVSKCLLRRIGAEVGDAEVVQDVAACETGTDDKNVERIVGGVSEVCLSGWWMRRGLF